MLTREQQLAFLAMQKRRGTIFSLLQKNLIRYMGEVSQKNFHPKSDIAKLLHHIAYGAHDDLMEIKRMLKDNPELVLQAGNVTTRSGLLVIRTTPLECALGSGSPEIAAIIHEAFDRITDKKGKKVAGVVEVRNAIYERYRPHIEKMLDQKPYDFTWLLNVIKQSSAEDISAELNNKMPHTSILRDAMEKFRADFTPGQMRKPGMHFAYNEHCNYATVIHILELCDSEGDSLRDGGNFAKNRLVARQIFGFIERSFCSDERMVFARDSFNAAIAGGALDRSLEYKCQPGTFFPDTVGDSSQFGLGFEYWAFVAEQAAFVLGVRWGIMRVEEFFRAKAAELIKLMPQRPESKHQAEKPSKCVIC